MLKLKEIAKGDTEAWKKLNYNERCAVYRERDKTKLIFIKKFRWIREKHPKHVNNKRRRKNARVTQRYRKRIRLRKMQDVLAKANKMILNKSSIQVDDHDKVLLCKGLRFASTPNWSKSVENAKWINAWQHVRRTEWNAVLGEKDDSDFVLPKKLSMPKASRPDSAKIDQETKTYVEMVFSKLRNIKPLLLEAYRTNNNSSHDERKSLSKLAKLTEERKIVICRADKDGKIVILNYDDYDAIMTRELQQFEKLDVSVSLELKIGSLESKKIIVRSQESEKSGPYRSTRGT